MLDVMSTYVLKMLDMKSAFYNDVNMFLDVRIVNLILMKV